MLLKEKLWRLTRHPSNYYLYCNWAREAAEKAGAGRAGADGAAARVAAVLVARAAVARVVAETEVAVRAQAAWEAEVVVVWAQAKAAVAAVTAPD